MGGAVTLTEFLGEQVELTFRYLDPAAETAALESAGFALVQRWDRDPYPEVEHASRRSYLLLRRGVRRPAATPPADGWRP